MVVRLILMRIAALIALTVLGSCRSEEEQPRFPDVHARLVLLDADPAVGSPLRVRLDLVNDSDTPMLFDAQQSEGNGSFEIRMKRQSRSSMVLDRPSGTTPISPRGPASP